MLCAFHRVLCASMQRHVCADTCAFFYDQSWCRGSRIAKVVVWYGIQAAVVTAGAFTESSDSACAGVFSRRLAVWSAYSSV